MGFGNNARAQRDRHRKAVALAGVLRLTGLTAADVGGLEAKSRRDFERRARVARSSDLTWAGVATLLERRPPTFTGDRPPGCDCEPNEHDVLVERTGWPCPHAASVRA